MEQEKMDSKKKIDKQAILNRRKQVPKEKYQIGEQTVWFRGLRSREMQAWLDEIKDPEKMDPNLKIAKMIQMSMVDEDGNLVFDETDIMALGDMWHSDMDPMLAVINRLNGSGPESQEAILKNLLEILGVDGLYGLLASINAPCPNCSKGTAATS